MFASKHSHHGILIRRHLHHGLNMCTGTIMDKLCICTSASDIYIIWTFRICILVKSVCIRNEKKSRLASHCVCIHKKLTSRSVVKSLSIACYGTMFASHIGKIDHGISFIVRAWHLHFAFVKMRKDERGIKQVQMKNKSKWLRYFIHA